MQWRTKNLKPRPTELAWRDELCVNLAWRDELCVKFMLQYAESVHAVLAILFIN